MSFKKVDPKQSFSKMEEEILKFWEEQKIFEKSVEKKAPKGDYVFYDGPPFATGTPHYGHIVASTMKDVVPRYWTMKGYKVERKWGWDCHGLPIENIAEKELGITRKKEILEMGVDKFNEACRSKVLGYVAEWKKVINRLGRWADMENSYKTMDLPFMESVWWVFKELWDKGLIYEGYRSMYICTRCETTLSQSEVAEGYRDIKDLSVTVKFELVDEPGTFILAWTTTPWTLIGNTALSIGKDIDYVKIKCHSELARLDSRSKRVEESNLKTKLDPSTPRSLSRQRRGSAQDDTFYILSENRLSDVMKDRKYEIISKSKGKDLIGKKYKPLFDYYSGDEKLPNYENGWKIYAGDFVTTEEGTGVVHIAPAFGEDDLNLSYKHKLPFIQHVGMDGVIKPEAKDFAGLSVKPMEDHQKTDVEVIKYLAKNNLLFAKEKYSHSYPHCWRCDTPLINYATSSWFVSVTKIKERMLELAKDINWSPVHIKEGRFGNWLEGARDWSISRQRFWASVIPIWKCEKCGEMKIFGSVAELERSSGQKITDLHKHIVDEITFPCEKCDPSTIRQAHGGELSRTAGSGQAGAMKRVPDVLDTWFDSGSMPYAQVHYPFENKEKFESGFPAEFIAEGQDQCRAWFYYLHVIATAIKDSRAFNNVIVNGIVVGGDGKKLAKRLKNYPDPMEIFEKYGADALRYYLLSSPVMAAENLSFKESDVADLVRGMFRMLWNSYSFFVLYANIDKFKVQSSKFKVDKANNLLDRWIISELNVLTREVNEAMSGYELNRAARYFPRFIDNLSNWYIRRSRKRFWKPARNASRSEAGGSEDEVDIDKESAYQTLYYVLVELSKLMAPFTPFIAEEIYRNLMNCHSEPARLDSRSKRAEESNSNLKLDPSTSSPAGESAQDDNCSVHLADFPEVVESLIDEKLNKEMEKTRNVITEALRLRAKVGIKVRQPLAELRITNCEMRDEFLDIIKEEVNIKEVKILKGQENKIELDTEITEELKLEGQAREIIRSIQEMRKEAGYEVDNRIKVCYAGLSTVFEKFGDLIVKEVLATELKEGKAEEFDLKKEFEIDGKKVKISIRR